MDGKALLSFVDQMHRDPARGEVIVEAGGDIVAGPLVEEEGILYADLDADKARGQRYAFDPVGHYARPDVFELTVHEEERSPVSATTATIAATGVSDPPDARPAASKEPADGRGRKG
jgi:hypothetical protein